jgi:ATP phosphoribosyltransferase regulatory subunit
MAFSPEQFQSWLALAGYEQRDTPLIEPAGLFLTKGGDGVIERLITFARGNQVYALRPEFTASASMLYAQGTGGVKRWQFFGPVFQEPVQVGGAFARSQIGAELIGWAGQQADAEVIGLAWEALARQNITGIRVIIGHAGLTREILNGFHIDGQVCQFLLNQRGLLAAGGIDNVKQKLERFLALSEIELDMPDGAEQAVVSTLLSITPRSSAYGGRTREEITRRLVQKRRRSESASSVMAALAFLADWVQIEGTPNDVFEQIQPYLNSQEAILLAAQWQETLSLLENYGLSKTSIVLRPDLNRVWDYYSGVMFELRTAQGVPLGGGGRYDGLMRLLGDGEGAPAIGFGLDVDAIREYTNDHDIQRQNMTQPLYVRSVDAAEAVRIVRKLRDKGFIVILGDGPAGHQIEITPSQWLFAGRAFTSRDDLTAYLETIPL